MSGIAGILHSGGRPVDPAELDRMLAAIAHRGRDGRSTWLGDRIGIGCNLFRTAPGPLRPILADRDLVLTADVRLDNGDELAAALGLRPSAATDGELILAAYERWGEDCAQHLLGDFAFALWDRKKQILYCARDHFGVKPFYFCRRSGDVFFASEMKALFTLAQVPHRIDEAKIADYLVGIAGGPETTIYADVRQLPPGHCLTLTKSGSRLDSYWRLEPGDHPRGDAAEQLRSIFTEAVRCRLRGDDPVGAMLSGGLDSSSIACVAAPIVLSERQAPLRTFSLVFDGTPELNERPFIEAVLSKGGFEPHFIDCGEYAPFADAEEILAEQEGVFYAPGLPVSRRLYHAAASQGVRVLLDGHGGDEVISHGHGRLHELARAGRWISLWRDVAGVSATYGDAAWPVFRAYFKHYGPGRSLRRARGAAARAFGRRQGSREAPKWSRLVNPELAARTGLVERHRQARAADIAAAASEPLRHAQLLGAPRVSQSFGVLDRAAAAAGIEPRYPFWDKRLVEFCLSLPSDEKLRDGWTRSILRRAMEGVLPAAVQWRRDKLDFGPHIVRGMLTRHRDTLDGIIYGGGDDLASFVDLGEVRAAYERIAARPDDADGYDVQIVWRTTMLALWLGQLAPAAAGESAAA